MFDIGFWELALIGILALLVVGPERLPKLAVTVGRWVGQARRSISNVQTEIERQVRLQDQQTGVRQTLNDLRSNIADVQRDLRSTGEQIRDAVQAPDMPQQDDPAQPESAMRPIEHSADVQNSTSATRNSNG